MASDSSCRSLHDAINEGDVEEVSALLDVCSDDVNAVYNGHTAMTYALEKCDDDIIPNLLMKHCHFDPHAKNRHQRSPLFESAKLGRDEVVTCLLRMGADVDERDRQDVTPLSICAVYNRQNTALLLLAHGADVNARDCHGDTPLHRACSHGSEQVVMVLLAHPGCDVSSVNDKRETALMLSLPSAYNVQVQGQPLSRSLTICRRLLQAGGDVVTSLATQPVLHDRVLHNDLAGACLLMHHCPFLTDSTDQQGLTPLELALSKSYYEMALCVLRFGGSPRRLLPTGTSQVCSPLTSGFFSGATAARTDNGTPLDCTLVSDFHKLRFLQAFLASSFMTIVNVSRLVDLGFLTSDLLRVVLANLGHETVEEKSADGQETVHQRMVGQRTTASHTEDIVDNGNGSLTNTDDLIASNTDGSGATTLTTSYDKKAVKYVCVAVRQSLTLQHQCRLAVRRFLGASLLAKLPHRNLGLPQRVQNYISLGPDLIRSSPLRVAELHTAITENDARKLKQLLEDGTDVNIPLMERTPLTRALELEPSHLEVTDAVTGDSSHICGLCCSRLLTNDKGRYEIVDNVTGVSKNYDETIRRDWTRSSLGDTSTRKTDVEERDVVSLLLRHGASPSLKDPLGDTPLHVAVRRGACVVKRFLAAVTSVSSSVHSTAAPSARHAVVSLPSGAAETGACLAASSEIPACGPAGIADSGNSGHATLIDSLDSITSTDRLGLTPLELSLLESKMDTARLLLLWVFRRAQAELKLGSQTTEYWPKHREAAFDAETLKIVSCSENTDRKEAALDVVGGKSITLTENDTVLTKLVSWVGITGVTVLHCAAAAGLPRVAETLVLHGSSVTSADALGKTAFQVATCKGQVYAEEFRSYCPRWYDDTFKSTLRVWPVCKPRAFRGQWLSRHQQKPQQRRPDVLDVTADQIYASGSSLGLQALAGTTLVCTQIEQGPVERGLRKDAGNPYPLRSLATLSNVSYQRTANVLLLDVPCNRNTTET